MIKTEHQEQKELIEYLEFLKLTTKNKIIFSAIPHETFTKSWGIKRKNKEKGVRSGVPDLLLIINDRLFFIEMKRTKGGILSESQKEWIVAIRDSETPCFVCKGFEEAKVIIDDAIKYKI